MSDQNFSRRQFLQFYAAGCSSLLAASAMGETQARHYLRGHDRDIVRPSLYPITIRTTRGRIELSSTGDLWLHECRPYLAWRLPGEAEWHESASPQIRNLEESTGRISFLSRFEFLEAEVRMTKRDDATWELAGALKNTGGHAVELARFHYLQGSISPRLGFLQLEGSGDFPILFQHGDSVQPFRLGLEAMWRKWKVFFPLLSEPIHDRPNWALSKDIGVFAENWTKPGWGCGFTGPGTAFGEIGFHTQSDPSQFFIGVLLDNILLEPGEHRGLEKAIVWCGDWQTGLNQWARACTKEFAVPRSKPPLVGYLSWYQHYSKVTPDDILLANEEFSHWPIPPGGRTIQIDDGWEVKPGEWQPNERFAKAWPGLPGRISRTGSIPGLWLAPTAIHESHPIARDHPEWLQHLPNGEFAVYYSNWGGKTYFLEIDRPEARAFMRGILKKVLAQGWRYLKIDFTYPVITGRKAFDSKKTSFQSLRGLYSLFREVCGPEILISACVGEPARYALGLADIARLGGDTPAQWPTAHGNMRRLLTLGATNGTWWQGDPDAFYMRTTATRLTEEENYLLTGTIGLFGGVFLTSDLPSQWSARARAAVKEFWNLSGPRVPADQRVLWSPAGEILAYRVSYKDGKVPHHQVGLYNCSEAVRDTRVALSDLGLASKVDWKRFDNVWDREVKLVDKTLFVERQPPHSLRIVGLSRPRS